MSVYLPANCVTYRYDFRWRRRRYKGSTGQRVLADAELVESKIKLRLRQQAGGVAPFDPKDSPRFQDWGEIYLQYQRRFVASPDVIKRSLVVVLEFWGSKPAKPRREPFGRKRRIAPPYHDLCLADPIADPSWLLKFDRWIAARGVSASTRNSYLSTVSGMYRVAMDPLYRQDTGITTNPFRDIRRGAQGKRSAALTPEQIIAWIREASYHVALAATIAALAPKLRLASILGLRWSEHFDADLRRITVDRHKTSGRTGQAQVTPISDQLRTVLLDTRSRQPDHDYVVAWRGEPVESIKTGAKRAATAVGLKWGIRGDGVTFHTIRHSIATLLAQLGMPERIRMELLGHSEIRTTQKYTHLAATTQVEPHETLSQQLPVAEVMLAKPRPKGKVVRFKRKTA